MVSPHRERTPFFRCVAVGFAVAALLSGAAARAQSTLPNESTSQRQKGLEFVAPTQKVITTLDLTKPFKTKSKWRLVVTQDPEDGTENSGVLHFCFLQNDKPHCSQPGFNIFGNVQTIRPHGMRENPLLVANMYDSGGGSARGNGPAVWVYRRERDKFEMIFRHLSNFSANEETRVIAKGPLAGDVVTDDATYRRRPYPYAITAYGLSPSLHYVKILAYEGRRTRVDSNRLAVIDAEMLEIEKRLHVWKPGDALPTPLERPKECNTVSIKDGLLVPWN